MAISYPNESYQLPFERTFDAEVSKAWMRDHWHESIYYSVVYVAAIYLGQHYMASRPAFQLRTPMAIWSACLAVFSIMGASRMVPHILFLLRNHGVYTVICDPSFYYYIPMAYWTYVFTISKLYELGDTVFIVARKQKLSFLHWYHHITVFMYCWQGYALDSPTGSPFGSMNFLVHAFMYTYYFLKAMRIRVPRQVNICITILQMLQMAVGVAITIAIYMRKRAGLPCAETDRVMYFAMLMYSSYLVLFINFFYQTYFKGSAKVHRSSENRNRKKKEDYENGVANGKNHTN